MPEIKINKETPAVTETKSGHLYEDNEGEYWIGIANEMLVYADDGWHTVPGSRVIEQYGPLTDHGPLTISAN